MDVNVGSAPDINLVIHVVEVTACVREIRNGARAATEGLC